MVERATPFAAPVSGTAPGLALSAVPRGSLWQIACWGDSFNEVEKSLAMACGCAEPLPGRAIETKDGRLLIRIEPLKWWIMGADGAPCPMFPTPPQGAVIDMSHDQATIAVEGANAAEVIKRMVALDMRDAAFPNLSFATTHLHHMITRVFRRDVGDTPRYEVMVMRSYADDLREIMAHHVHHMS